MISWELTAIMEHSLCDGAQHLRPAVPFPFVRSQRQRGGPSGSLGSLLKLLAVLLQGPFSVQSAALELLNYTSSHQKRMWVRMATNLNPHLSPRLPRIIPMPSVWPMQLP